MQQIASIQRFTTLQHNSPMAEAAIV